MLQRSLAPSMLLVLLTAILLIMLAFAPSALAARPPSGTGQPGAECNEGTVTQSPQGFNTDGFAHAESVYAGSGQSSHSNNDRAKSQYDVACYQLSSKGQ
jgi:hypothetical protein